MCIDWILHRSKAVSPYKRWTIFYAVVYYSPFILVSAHKLTFPLLSIRFRTCFPCVDRFDLVTFGKQQNGLRQNEREMYINIHFEYKRCKFKFINMYMKGNANSKSLAKKRHIQHQNNKVHTWTRPIYRMFDIQNTINNKQ